MSSASTFNCFGLVIHGYPLETMVTEIQTRSAQGLPTWIVTANPEILLHAKNNPEYWEVIRQADFRVVDGMGLKFAGWVRGARPKRCVGVELAEAVAKLCVQNHWTLGMIGSQEGVADKAAWHLRKKYPNLMVFSENGGNISPDGHLDEKAEASLTHLVEIEPDVVLVAYGHPKQDFWIQKYRSRLPKAKVFIGVGGTLDFWAENAKRAPQWMRSMGFEWLWRLFTQPWRWKRIWNALIVFPFAVLLDQHT
ncbi:MAG: WecB/TagA/CpsF family glycosyltransferase [Patescibacteria group bacterium]|nr:WecB/TagA/CpsF family glycosyltransferase [Patescibacteria group bacterium]